MSDQPTTTTKILTWVGYGVITLVVIFGLLGALGGDTSSKSKSRSAPTTQQQLF